MCTAGITAVAASAAVKGFNKFIEQQTACRGWVGWMGWGALKGGKRKSDSCQGTAGLARVIRRACVVFISGTANRQHGADENCIVPSHSSVSRLGLIPSLLPGRHAVASLR